MIGYVEGEIIFSDGREAIIKIASGIGYQVYNSQVLPEGSNVSLFLSQIIRETSQDLYSFSALREKKMFELLLSVKGVGPKSAFALVGSFSCDQLINSIKFEDKRSLSKAPGVGAKAASQIILDLQGKIDKVAMYSETYSNSIDIDERDTSFSIVEDALMACKELGFQEAKVLPLMRKIMEDDTILKAEQLVHLVLREL